MKEANLLKHPGADLIFISPVQHECTIRQEFCDYYVADCPFPDCSHVCEEAAYRSAELHAMVHKSTGNCVDS